MIQKKVKAVKPFLCVKFKMTEEEGKIAEILAEGETKILALKDEGNAALVAGSIANAVDLYTQALDASPESLSAKNKAVILSNRAQAYIKIENYGLAISDATDAIEADPSYPKAYYRRGTAEFALNKPKAARKDFKMVCKLKPKDRDARTRYAECEKMVKEAAFAAAIMSAKTDPLSETYDPAALSLGSYDGPHPSPSNAPFETGEMDKEDAIFEPGNLPIEFVMVCANTYY